MKIVKITAALFVFIPLSIITSIAYSESKYHIWLKQIDQNEAHKRAHNITPPMTWQEHWFEHKQNLKLISYNKDIAIYFDKDVPKSGTEWLNPFMTKLWKYTKKTYGNFGSENRLYCIFHQGKYSGGHPSTYFDESHDYRNVSDCGLDSWKNQNNKDYPSHETMHVVEGANNGVHGSPAFGIWGDSKWAEFYQFDIYSAMGLKVDASRVYNKFINGSDDFPQKNTHWFRDWFYPLWRDHGHANVMVRFFKLLAKYYPKEKEGNHLKYSREMNWGEYIHFMSGAAGQVLTPMAAKAFGWNTEWDSQLKKAKSEFPNIKY